MFVRADRDTRLFHRLNRFSRRARPRAPQRLYAVPAFSQLRVLVLTCVALVALASGAASSSPRPDSSPAQIREIVAAEMQALERVYFRIDGREREVVDLGVSPDGLVLVFESSTLLLKTNRKDAPNGRVGYYTEWRAGRDSDEPPPGIPFVEGRLKRSRPDGDHRFRGTLSDPEGKSPDVEMDLRLNEALLGGGTSCFEIDGSRAFLRGVLGSRTYAQLDTLIQEHPTVRTIVFQEVPGSMNDEINVHTGRLLRAAGLSTLVPADGMAASGGVDLFAAGLKREAEPGARLGIHAWCCYRGREAQEITRGHRAHAHQEAYFREMMGPQGIEFYYQTLEAAPPERIHWMTREELEASGLLTN